MSLLVLRWNQGSIRGNKIKELYDFKGSKTVSNCEQRELTVAYDSLHKDLQNAVKVSVGRVHGDYIMERGITHTAS